eukprot:gnl/TRDRNA2_/TRDRNA2_200117_c0_seq1.p2 gnl/TRDRNA2_/TRDRNA2_200117_c0~~gnl/TRDRNA2_/TRDRNA2_200117_c0_seq1.p2  ORF type:complete len:127 (+),score=23.26 gnl/TRDRNA2_/TRDRNA2_200117_c0_seq1:353-733(+)
MELQKHFPGVKIEGGPYTPPAYVQYGIRAVRASQVALAVFFFFGEQLFGAMGRSTPELYGQMHENPLILAGALYGVDLIAQTLKSINAFEVTYNGQVLHSKLKSGNFPEVGQVARALKAAKKRPVN